MNKNLSCQYLCKFWSYFLCHHFQDWVIIFATLSLNMWLSYYLLSLLKHLFLSQLWFSRLLLFPLSHQLFFVCDTIFAMLGCPSLAFPSSKLAEKEVAQRERYPFEPPICLPDSEFSPFASLFVPLLIVSFLVVPPFVVSVEAPLSLPTFNFPLFASLFVPL